MVILLLINNNNILIGKYQNWNTADEKVPFANPVYIVAIFQYITRVLVS